MWVAIHANQIVFYQELLYLTWQLFQAGQLGGANGATVVVQSLTNARAVSIDLIDAEEDLAKVIELIENDQNQNSTEWLDNGKIPLERTVGTIIVSGPQGPVAVELKADTVALKMITIPYEIQDADLSSNGEQESAFDSFNETDLNETETTFKPFDQTKGHSSLRYFSVPVQISVDGLTTVNPNHLLVTLPNGTTINLLTRLPGIPQDVQIKVCTFK